MFCKRWQYACATGIRAHCDAPQTLTQNTMADISTSAADRKEKEYFTSTPQQAPGFFLKGSHQYDWGLKNRLSKVFNPKDGRTVMLAFDHGYFQGPTSGLERVDQTILPLEPYADCLMLTRGIQRSVIPASTQKAIALRASGGTSMVSPFEEWEGEIDGKKARFGRPGFEPLSNESTALNIEEAIRLNASILAVQVFIGSAYERQSLKNMTDLVDAASRYGIGVMGVVAVGRAMTRNAQYFRLATRIMAELGANVVKCYYTDKEFETVTSYRHLLLPGAHRHRRRQEAAGARRAENVRQRHQAGRVRRGHGPQHLPERRPGFDDAGCAGRGSRRPEREQGFRNVQRLEEKGAAEEVTATSSGPIRKKAPVVARRPEFLLSPADRATPSHPTSSLDEKPRLLPARRRTA